MLYLKRETMNHVDQHAVARVTLEKMMPFAGKRLAEFILGNDELMSASEITLLFERGLNGGGGLFALAHLLEKNYKGKIRIVPGWNLAENPHGIDFVGEKFSAMNAEKYVEENISDSGILIDALLGYRLNSNPRTAYARIINEANASGLTIVSLDVPSGLNTQTGAFYKKHIKPNYVLSLDVAKHGLEPFVSSLFVADLGFTQDDYDGFVVKYARPFSDEKIVKVKSYT